MKKLKLILLLLTLTSCGSQSDFDMSAISLPMTLDGFDKEIFNIDEVTVESIVYDKFTSNNNDFFVFDNIKFVKEFSEQYSSPSRIEFWVNKEKGK